MAEKCGVCGGQLKNAVQSAGPEQIHTTDTLKFDEGYVFF